MYRIGFSTRTPLSRIVAAIALITAGAQISSCALLNDNFRPVEKQNLYRSAQMSGAKLNATLDWYGIKTVINLRGTHPDESWYRDEIAACTQNDVEHLDLQFTMRAIPTPEDLLQLVEWFESKPKPILVHCQAGIHRAGTASAVYELMQGKTSKQSKKQFGIYFLNAPIGALVDLYDGNKPFAQWVREDYPAVYAQHIAAKEAAQK